MRRAGALARWATHFMKRWHRGSTFLHASAQDWRCIRGDTDPVPTFVNPSVNKSLPADVGLSGFDALGSKYSGGDCSIAEDVDVHRFGRDLLLLGVGFLYACQKGCFGLLAAVIVNQHNLIVEDSV